MSNRFHSVRGLISVVLLAAATFGGLIVHNAVVNQQKRTFTTALVNSLSTADIAQVPSIVEDLTEYREFANPLLKTRLSELPDGSPEKLRLTLALLPMDESQLDYLAEQLPVCLLKQYPVLREALLPYKDKLSEGYWQIAVDEQIEPSQRFQAAAALAEYAPKDDRWQGIAPFVAQHLTTAVSSVNLGHWVSLFQRASDKLVDSLTVIHANRSRSENERESAAFALSEYLRDAPVQILELILIADQQAEFSPLIDVLKLHAPAVQQRLLDEMRATTPAELDKTNDQLSEKDEQRRDAHWHRQSMAAVTLVHLGFSDDVWPLLEFTPNPSLRSFIIHHLSSLGADHNVLASKLQLEKDDSIRRALIQSLGGLNSALIPPTDRSRIEKQLKWLFVNDPDSGIHSSVSWTLRKWGITLPELPVGEPTFTDEQKQRIADLSQKVDDLKQQIAKSEVELPVRQAAWEQTFREQPATLPQSLSVGLVAHFPFDETAGIKTANFAKDVPNGVFEGLGQPEWTTGVVGGAAKLDGRGGHFNCGEMFEFKQTKPLSLAGWFYVEPHSRRGVLLAKFDQQNQRGFCINIDALNDEILCEWTHDYPENRMSVSSHGNGIARQWHHLVVTYDGASAANGVTIYLDGHSVPTTVVADKLTDSIETTVPVQIGIRGEAYRYHGAIDDLLIYDRTLTEGEVERLFETGLRSVVAIPTKNRSAAQQELLTKHYAMVDEPLIRSKNALGAAQTALGNAQRDGIPHWYVNSEGQTMVVISNPSENGQGETGYSFAISSHEVTVAEFRRFRPQHGIVKTVAPSPSHPIHRVSWYQAASYCNWLSEQAGIPQEQWCYEPNENGLYADGMKFKASSERLAGYRLPNDVEWQLACRAGTSGSYCFGEPVCLLEQYAVFGKNSAGRSDMVERHLPNEHGLFDMHGNIAEWSENPWSGSFSPVINDTSRVTLGGLWYSLPPNIQSSNRRPYRPNFGDVLYGFRPVRTYQYPPNTFNLSGQP